MNVFVANFGQENYEWPACRDRGTVATMNDLEAQPLWEAGDREGYILSRMRRKTAAGLTPTRAVASRWYNLMTIVSETSGDLWFHRDGERLWWTISRSDPPSFERRTEPVGRKREVIVCHKPCEPWSHETRAGKLLFWNSLHPKARDFLSTEATLQKLCEDYAAYAIALVSGTDLTPWHSLPVWRARNDKASSKASEVRSYSRKQIAAYREAQERMAETAQRTVDQANGQTATRTVKNKEMRFSSPHALEQHILALIEMQEGLCALTGLPLEFDEREGDPEFFSSLDRIDSNGHYEDGNLQIVCRFANRWKGTDDDTLFRRLVDVLREGNT
ncbi:MAG: hypothetical protein ACFCUS_08905 [Rubrimonas sp.]